MYVCVCVCAHVCVCVYTHIRTSPLPSQQTPTEHVRVRVSVYTQKNLTAAMSADQPKARTFAELEMKNRRMEQLENDKKQKVRSNGRALALLLSHAADSLYACTVPLLMSGGL